MREVTTSLPPTCPPSHRPKLPMASLAKLSEAERLVAIHVRQGLSNKEIAQALGKADATIKHQVSSCLAKLRINSRVRLVILLLEEERERGMP